MISVATTYDYWTVAGLMQVQPVSHFTATHSTAPHISELYGCSMQKQPVRNDACHIKAMADMSNNFTDPSNEATTATELM